MKLKKILVLSLAINAVLLSAMGYIATLPVEPKPVPPAVIIIRESNSAGIEAAASAIAEFINH